MPGLLFFFFFLAALSACGELVGKGAAKEDEISIHPEKVVVEYGASIVLNCSHSCGKIFLETSLKQTKAGNGPTWSAFNISKVGQWAPSPLCFSNCDVNLKTRRVNFTVYRAPEIVELFPLPKMEVGKKYDLACWVLNVAPIQNLTVTMFKGEEAFLVMTFENHTKPEPGNITVNTSITVELQDRFQNITCRATLDLRPEGPLLEKTSSSESLEPVVFVMDPLLSSPSYAEIDTETTVTCEVSEIFPAEEAKFELSFAGENLPFNISVLGKTVRAKAPVVPSSVGNHTLICTVSLGPVHKTVNKTMNVYALPKPILDIDHVKILVNRTVTVTCTLDGPESPGVKMQLKDNQGILASKDLANYVIEHQVTTCEEDDGKEFVCETQLVIDDVPIVKNTSVKLIVFYGPRITDSSCPSMWTWKEDSMETFICSGHGNPPPTTECRKDNVTYSIGVQQQVKRKHAGIYKCIALNAYGVDTKDVTIVVEFFQLNTLAIALSVLSFVVLFSMATVAYYMYYRNQKVRKYHLKQKQQQQSAGNSMEQKCLNGNVDA